jgi:hypothetical protein
VDGWMNGAALHQVSASNKWMKRSAHGTMSSVFE